MSPVAPCLAPAQPSAALMPSGGHGATSVAGHLVSQIGQRVEMGNGEVEWERKQ